jgi:hypothetical protein
MLRLNIGFNRKVGEANFGSRGASVNLEIEVESGVVREPEKLQAKINYLFDLAKASVDAQLNGSTEPQQPPPVAANNNGGNGSYGNGSRHASGEHQQGGNGSTNGHYAGGNGNGTTNGHHASGNGNGSGNGHRASEKQINFATNLAKGIRGLGVRRLESLTGRLFGKPLADLTSFDASSLIDTLKAIKDGRVSLEAALNEGTAA